MDLKYQEITVCHIDLGILYTCIFLMKLALQLIFVNRNAKKYILSSTKTSLVQGKKKQKRILFRSFFKLPLKNFQIFFWNLPKILRKKYTAFEFIFSFSFSIFLSTFFYFVCLLSVCNFFLRKFLLLHSPFVFQILDNLFHWA